MTAIDSDDERLKNNAIFDAMNGEKSIVVGPKYGDGGGMFIRFAESDTTKEIIEALIKKGADINGKGGNGFSPLHNAAKSNPEMVKMIIDLGGNVKNVTNGNQTPLHYLVDTSERYKIAEYKASGEQMSDERIKKIDEKDKAIASAIKLLKGKGADMDAPDNEGLTPYLQAALAGDTKVMDLLADNGAERDAKDNKGQNAFYKLVSAGRATKENIEYMQTKASVGGTDKSENTLLHVAAQNPILTAGGALKEKQTEKMMVTLLEIPNLKSRINETNDEDKTALHYGINNAVTTKILLDNGANPNLQDNRGNTPLHSALKEISIVRDPTAKDLDLKLATVDLLLEKTTLSTKNKDGKTPLQMAQALLAEAEKEPDSALWKEPNVKFAKKLVDALEKGERKQAMATGMPATQQAVSAPVVEDVKNPLQVALEQFLSGDMPGKNPSGNNADLTANAGLPRRSGNIQI